MADELDFSLPNAVVHAEMPELSGIPQNAQQILILRSCGYTLQSIADAFKVTKQAIQAYIDRYDPDRVFTVTPKLRREILSSMLEQKIGLLAMNITTEGIKKMNVGQVVQAIATGVRALIDLSNSKTESTKNKSDESLLDSLTKKKEG